jgi:hypothetical protein
VTAAAQRTVGRPRQPQIFDESQQRHVKKGRTMNTPIPRRSQQLLGLVCAAIAIAVAACSANGTGPSTNSTLPQGAHRPPASTPTPPPYSWTFQPVNYTNGGNNTRITGLNDDESPGPTIVGVNGATHGTNSSFTVPYPYATGFNTQNNFGANGTYIATVNNEAHYYEGGTEFSPPASSPLACTTCAVVYDTYGTGTGYGRSSDCNGQPCEWTFLQDPNQGTQSCAVTEGQSVGDAEILVGYYETGASNCQTQAFESYYVNGTGEKFVDFNVPGAAQNSTEALGTNPEGDVVGIGSFAGSIGGWFYQDGMYCTGLAFPSAVSTYPLAINWQDNVVGYYTGSDGVPHGFLLVNPGADQNKQTWEQVTDTDSSVPNNYTVVTGVNNHHQITGYFKNSSGQYQGFVGMCITQNCGNGVPSKSQISEARRRAIRDLIARRPEAASSGCSVASDKRRERK